MVSIKLLFNKSCLYKNRYKTFNEDCRSIFIGKEVNYEKGKMMTEDENNKSESKEEQLKFNQQHYYRLIECSKKGAEGIKEWIPAKGMRE